MSATERPDILGEADISPAREAAEPKHLIPVTVEAEESGCDAENVEDDPHPHHVPDGEPPRRVDDGIGRGGHRQHEGVAGGESDAQGEVQRVELKA